MIHASKASALKALVKRALKLTKFRSGLVIATTMDKRGMTANSRHCKSLDPAAGYYLF